jgi:hypothetical protein
MSEPAPYEAPQVEDLEVEGDTVATSPGPITNGT